jgi:hypothetical protein
MFLLIAGAIISSLIIPYYTRQWQDHQKELELKTNFADDVNKAVSEMIVSAIYRNPHADLYQTNNDWLIAKAMISSKVKAYFSDIRMTQDWNNLSSVVTQLFFIEEGLPPKNQSSYNNYFCQLLGGILKIHEFYPDSGPMNIDRSEVGLHHCDGFYYSGLEDIQYVQKYFPARNGDIDWNALLHLDNHSAAATKEYQKSFVILEKDIENHIDKFLDIVFKSPITAFE